MSITVGTLLGRQRFRFKPLLLVTAACVVTLSVLGVSFGSIAVFAAMPLLASTPFMVTTNQHRLPGEWNAGKIAAAQEVLRTGAPLAHGPYAGLWFKMDDGKVIFGQDPDVLLTLPITTRRPASEVRQRAVAFILAHGALVALPAFALMLVCLSRDWLPAWMYLCWIPLYLAMAAALLLGALPAYSTPGHWKIEVSIAPVRFAERSL